MAWKNPLQMTELDHNAKTQVTRLAGTFLPSASHPRHPGWSRVFFCFPSQSSLGKGGSCAVAGSVVKHSPRPLANALWV